MDDVDIMLLFRIVKGAANMIDMIRKRDGRVIPFNSEKITRAIFLAASEAAKKEGRTADYSVAEALTDDAIAFINKKFAGQVPTVEEVQDAVVRTLIKTGHAKTSEIYILYRAERTRIRDSKNRLMQDIHNITFLDSEDADIKRENANIDGNTPMGIMLQYGSAVSKEFCKKFVIKPEHALAHERGDIHIHDMDFLNMGTTTCCQIDISKLFDGGFSTGHGYLREPNDVLSYAALAAIAIQANQNDQHGGQSIPKFDYDMAKGVMKSFKKRLKENISKFAEIELELSDGELDEFVDSVLVDYGAVRSIEFLDDEKERLSECIEKAIAGKSLAYTDEAKSVSKKMVEFALGRSLKEVDKQTYQAMEAFVHNLNTMHSRAGAQVPFSSINFGTDITPEGRLVSKNLMLAQEHGLGNGETPIFPILIFKVKGGINLNESDPNYDLFKLACKVSAKRLFPNFAFLDAPFNKNYYKEGKPETEVTYMGCRTRVMGNIFGEEVAPGRGNISFSSMNLPRIGLNHGTILGERTEPDMEGFYRELDEKIELTVNQLIERFEIQGSKRVKNFPFLMGQGAWIHSDELGPDDKIRDVIKHGSLTIGFIGLAETLKALIGEHHGESERAQKLGLEIVEHMRKRADEAAQKHSLNFALIATPAEGLSGRFLNIDKKQYGVIEGVTDKQYYTNSFHIPVGYKLSAYDKIGKEAPYHEFTNGGHISYVELDGDPSDNVEAFESIVKHMATSGIGYGSINHPVDRCPSCGYTGIIRDMCPECGIIEGQNGVRFERIRRITGYLVGTVDRFNDAKKSEVKDRVKHV